jgi:type I restriction enzyme S subunit
MIVGLMQNKIAIDKLSQKWDILPFENIFKDSSGGNIKIKSKETLEEGLLPIIDQGKSFIAGYTNNIKSKADVNVPLIVFGDHTRILKYVDFDFAMGADGTKVLEIINNNAFPKFVYYYLMTINITNTGYNRHFKYVKDLVFPLPPLKTQQRIAGILDDAAALRDKTAQLLTEYDLLAQSVFLEMFGDIGMSNKKENFTPLKNLVVQKPDNGFFAKNELYVSGGVPIVWLNNFIDKLYIEQEDLRRAQILPKDEKYSLEYGDALFCRSSLTAEGIGKCAIVPKKMKEKTLFECHIIRLKFNLNKIIPEYFRFLSDTGYFRANIGKRSKTSTMTTISQDGITDIKIPVPPIKLQIQFADKIALIEQQKTLAKQELQESEDLFNCLLQQAFKGELV